MKLDKECTVWINCRTMQEQDEILDIFEAIGAEWASKGGPRERGSHTTPMHYLLENGSIRHGSSCVTGREGYVKGGTVVEAKDFHNQLVALRRRRR